MANLLKIITLCGLLTISSFASSFKLQGIIASADHTNKTITVDSIYGDSVVVKILPNTEIEMNDCGIFGIDK